MSQAVAKPSQVDEKAVASAQDRLDAHVRDIVRWHFDPATGCPFWLERARSFDFDSRFGSTVVEGVY